MRILLILLAFVIPTSAQAASPAFIKGVEPRASGLRSNP